MSILKFLRKRIELVVALITALVILAFSAHSDHAHGQPTSAVNQYEINPFEVYDFKNSFGRECTVVRETFKATRYGYDDNVVISVDCH